MSPGNELLTRDRLRGLRFVVLVVLAASAAFVSLAAWGVSSPVGSTADDDFHVPSIWCRSEAGQLNCLPAGPTSQNDVGVVLVRLPDVTPVCYAYDPTISGNCEVQDSIVVRVSDWLYPPLFYNYASIFAGDSPSTGIFTIRLGVAASVVAIFTLAYLVSLPWLRAPMLVSWVISSMPLGVSLFASTNPSAWAVAGLAAMWGPMVTAFLTTGRARWVAAVVWLLAGLMAAGSRGDAALFVAGMSGLGIVLLFRRDRWPVALVGIVPILTSAALFFASGHSKLASDSFVDTVDKQPPASIKWSLVEALPTLWSALTGAPWGRTSEQFLLGWLDTPMQSGVWLTLTFVVGGFLFAGIGVYFGRKALAIAALLLVALALPSRSLLQSGALAGTLFQPRYILPLLIVIVGLVLLARPGQIVRFTRGQLIVAWILLTFAATIALHGWIRRFVTGVDVVDINLDRNREWWLLTSLTPNQVWIVGSIAWAVLTAIALSHLWPRRQGRNATATPSRESAAATP